MKNLLSICIVLLLSTSLDAQTVKKETSKYLGLTPPGLTPEKFAPGVVSLDGRYEFGSVFSKNGEEFFFAANNKDAAEIWYMKLEKGVWTTPVKILAHPVYSHNDPYLSNDETKLFFISDRPVAATGPKKDYDIWYAKREGSSWSGPINAGPAINSDGNEYYVCFVKNGSMYFSSNRADKSRGEDYDIYTAKSSEEFQPAAAIKGKVNTHPDYEGDVFVAPDESYVIFCGVRSEGLGNGDLYIAFKNTDGTWAAAKNMGDVINTPGSELCPVVTKDGKYFLYTSRQDIYWVDAKFIEHFRPK